MEDKHKDYIDEAYEVAFNIFNKSLGYYQRESVVRTINKDGKITNWGASEYSWYATTPDRNGYSRYEKLDYSTFRKWEIIKIEKKENGLWTSIWERKEGVITDPESIFQIDGKYFSLKEIQETIHKLNECKELLSKTKS